MTQAFNGSRLRDHPASISGAILALLLTLVAGLPCVRASAQLPAEPEASSVRFVPGSVRVGLGGVTTNGGWTPLRVELKNPTDADADLSLAWVLPDAGGDRVAMQRRVAVPAGRSVAAWLYGVPPAGDAPPAGWTLTAADPDGAVVASASVRPDAARQRDPGDELLVVMSPSDLGLGDYTRHAASHADRVVVRGLTLDGLPDRVQGLMNVSAIIWAADGGGDPQAAGVPVRALSAWVRRGGQLVVVLPSVGERWTQSPLASLLPLPPGASLRRRPIELPTLGITRPAGAAAFDAYVLPEGEGAGSVLLRATGGEPLVTTVRRGFGSVTLIGLDLTGAALRGEKLPNGTRRFWNDVFGWSDPAVSEQREAVLRGELAATPPKIKPARELPDVEVGSLIAAPLRLGGSVTVALSVVLVLLLLLPLAVFAAWARARRRGPLGRSLRRSWPLFAAACVAAGAVGWLVSVIGRPGSLSLRHASVVDIDPTSGLQRTRSRVSLFVPGFGRAGVRVGEAAPAAAGLLSPGALPNDAATAFLDPQAYAMDAAQPDAADLPLRSTTRALGLDSLVADVPPAARRVSLSGRAVHRAGTSTLRVSLQSTLPVDLRDVLVVYCPGEAFVGAARQPLTPLAWRLAGDPAGVWPAGGTLALDGVPADATPLAALPTLGEPDAGAGPTGWLNAVLGQAGVGAASSPQPGDRVDDPVRAAELLSFFGRLPSPDVSTLTPPFGAVLRRSVPGLRGLDLSHLTSSPRLIVLGHADEAPLPVPLLVDGVEPAAAGRVLYRVILDLEEENRSAP